MGKPFGEITLVNRSKFAQYILELEFKYARHSAGMAFSALGRILVFFKFERLGTKFILMSIRSNNNRAATRYLSCNMTKLSPSINMAITNGVSQREAFARTIILSFPRLEGGVIVKGVVLVTFTRTCSYFLSSNWFSKLDELFVFVLEPSWTGYADADLLSLWFRATDCLFQATEIEDRTFLNAIDPKGIALSFGAGNWVDESIFRPIAVEKKYDSIYVANLNPVKRVYRYIKAIKNIVEKVDTGYQGMLVCASWGSGSLSEIQQYIQRLKLEDNIELSGPLSQPDMMRKIAESKVSILLSLKEGSSRILFESMMLDVPVICLSENIGVNKSYINASTGLLVADTFLEETLLSMQDNWPLFSPREWAVENISPQATTYALKKALELKFGQSCDTELYEKVNSPEVKYKNYAIDPEELNGKFFGLLSRSDTIDWEAIASIKAELLAAR